MPTRKIALACAFIFLIVGCGAEESLSSGGAILDAVTIFNDTRIVYSRAFGVADLPSAKPLGTDTEIYGLPGWRWFEPDQTLRIHCDHAAPGVC